MTRLVATGHRSSARQQLQRLSEQQRRTGGARQLAASTMQRGLLRTGMAALRPLALGLMVLALLTSPQAWTQSSGYTPYQLKALYLYNFAKYTEWPKAAFADESAPFVLGILGHDPFGKDVEIIKGKTVKGRKIEVRYFSNPQEVSGCQLLFIDSSETNNLGQILKALENASVLTIAESDSIVDKSWIISLVPEQKSSTSQTIAFEINLAAAGKANLKIDTQLLKLAKKVKS